MRILSNKYNKLLLILVALTMMAADIAPIAAAELSKADIAAYRAAFAAAKSENWRKVKSRSAATHEKLPGKVLSWLRYRSITSKADFAELSGFILANPDWPGMRRLRRRTEEAISNTVPDSELMAWFEKFPPITSPGSVRYARALLAAGRTEQATTFIRKAWESLDMSPGQENSFRMEFRKYLRKEDHIARLDRLVWDQQSHAAKRQMRRVDSGYRYLAEARLMLARRHGGVDNAIARIPQALLKDPGLAYERLRWRRKKNFTDAAVELLHTPPVDLVRPNKWWVERAILARRALRRGDITLAYRLAHEHGPVTGAALAEAEWLAGWIALRYLNDDDVALRHFTTMYNNVRYPISQARGAYWAGRAAEAGGITNRAITQKWYGVAAEHFTTFYGQLALNRLAAPTGPIREPAPNSQDITAFNSHEMVRLVRMLAELGQEDLAETFLEKLMIDAEGEANWALIAKLTIEVGRSDLSVRVAKKAIRDGVVLTRTGYPSLPVPLDVPTDPALVHAVIRQESAFDPTAISGAGARGLMQLMPATAKGLARQMKVRHSRSRLISDPAHNLNLGSAYLAQLIDNFDGSIVLALAAYNAGPSRVNRWLVENGDPRESSILDAVDWVETIPYSETRNYVQRVLENLPIYGYRLQDEFEPLKIVDALTGSDRISIP